MLLRFSLGTGHIWLDEVHCSGLEYFIDQCSHDSLSENDCSHFEDAAVVCLRESNSAMRRGFGYKCRILWCSSIFEE